MPVETAMLAEETATYNVHKAELLRTAPGKYVVIKGADVFGIFDDGNEAYAAGYRQFRPQAFLVQKIEEHEPIFYVGGSMLHVKSSE